MTSKASMRAATPADRDLLVRMMGDFYAESTYPFDARSAAGAFEALLRDSRVGRAWILLDAGEAAGYFVMTLGYSMEFGGTSAFLDDLWIRPASRGRGLGRLALATLREACETAGVRVAHLEVDPANERAVALYREAGFRERRLRLMNLELPRP